MALRNDLISIRELLEDPAHWIQGSYARNRPDGKVVPPLHPDATCWCLDGAVIRVVPPKWRYAVRMALVGTGKACTWNDAPERTHADVLGAIDKALARVS